MIDGVCSTALALDNGLPPKLQADQILPKISSTIRMQQTHPAARVIALACAVGPEWEERDEQDDQDNQQRGSIHSRRSFCARAGVFSPPPYTFGRAATLPALRQFWLKALGP
jgi:hypothetical protein